MKAVLVSGYPKSGNSLMLKSLVLAGRSYRSSRDISGLIGFDIHGHEQILRGGTKLSPNPVMPDGCIHIKSHYKGLKSTNFNCWHGFQIQSHILITRNPFDVLLSALNWIGSLGLEMSQFKETLDLLLPRYNYETYADKAFNIEFLREEGLLDECLQNFSRFNSVFPFFSSYAGNWSGFSDSFSHLSLPTLRLRFEDVTQDFHGHYRETALRLCSHLDINDAEKISAMQSGFMNQQKHAMKQLISGDPNKPQAKAYYFVNYFSRKSIKEYVENNYCELIRNGYEDLADSCA